MNVNTSASGCNHINCSRVFLYGLLNVSVIVICCTIILNFELMPQSITSTFFPSILHNDNAAVTNCNTKVSNITKSAHSQTNPTTPHISISVSKISKLKQPHNSSFFIKNVLLDDILSSPFHVLLDGLPGHLYDDIYYNYSVAFKSENFRTSAHFTDGDDSETETFGGNTNPKSKTTRTSDNSHSQYIDSEILQYLMQHKMHESIRNKSLIFIIPNAITILHFGDWERHLQKKGLKRSHKTVEQSKEIMDTIDYWPIKGWPFRREHYWRDVLLFIKHNWLTDGRHLKHCLIVICHFYTIALHEWTLPVMRDAFEKYQSELTNNGKDINLGGLERIGILSVIHPLNAPGNNKRFENNQSIKQFEYDSTYGLHIIVPFWHNFKLTYQMLKSTSKTMTMASSSGINNNSNNTNNNNNNNLEGIDIVGIQNFKKYFATGIFSFDSANHSPIYRKNLLTAFSYVNNCDTLNFVGHDHKNDINSDINNDNDNSTFKLKLTCKSLQLSRRQHNIVKMSQIIQIYQESIFCAVTRGDIENGRRIYTIILSGCIPVIIGADAHWFAFDDIIDWKSFTVFIPEIIIDPFIHNGSNLHQNWVYYLWKHYVDNDNYNYKEIQKLYENLLSYQSVFGYYTRQLYDKYIKPFDVNKLYKTNAIDMLVCSMQIRAFSLYARLDWLKRNGPTEYQAQVAPHFMDQFADRALQRQLGLYS